MKPTQADFLCFFECGFLLHIHHVLELDSSGWRFQGAMSAAFVASLFPFFS